MPRPACVLATVCYFVPIGAWLSLVERTVRDREVGGSNPLAPTISFRYLTTCVRRALAWRPKVTGFTQERTVHPCTITLASPSRKSHTRDSEIGVLLLHRPPSDVSAVGRSETF